ncbi:site-specific integrase [Listeria grayi]|uniref:site-specific integrase n=1 Tax=Listeria grayi TaxID=1641 RepID=UPI00019F2A06
MNPVSGKPWAITRLNELLKKVEQKTGFHVHPHMLRHTFATQAALSGIDRSEV